MEFHTRTQCGIFADICVCSAAAPCLIYMYIIILKSVIKAPDMSELDNSHLNPSNHKSASRIRIGSGVKIPLMKTD